MVDLLLTRSRMQRSGGVFYTCAHRRLRLWVKLHFERLRTVREITVSYVLPLTQPLPIGERRHRTVISRTVLKVQRYVQ